MKKVKVAEKKKEKKKVSLQKHVVRILLFLMITTMVLSTFASYLQAWK
jgi:hypothetical protein